MRNRSITAAVVCLLVLTLATVGRSAALTEATLTFIAPAPEPTQVELQGRDGGWEGQLTVALRNDSGAERVIRFDVVITDAVGRDRQSTPAPGTTLRVLDTEPKAVMVPPFSVLSIAVSLRADRQDATKYDGVLVARDERSEVSTTPEQARPATLRFRASVPQPVSSWAGAKPDPKGVTMTVTCWLMCRSPIDLLEDSHRPVRLSSAPGADEVRTVRLMSDTGGSLLVTLEPAGETTRGKVGEATADWRVRAGDIERSGKYTGELVLAPAASGAPQVALPITVNAQDLILWPWATLGLGVIAAWLFSKRRDQSRPPGVLLAAIMRIDERYRDIRRGTSDDPDCPPPCTYESVFPSRGAGYPTAAACRALSLAARAALTEAERLYCDIQTAGTNEELEERRTAVNDLAARVADWKPTRDAARDLCEALKTAEREIVDGADVPILATSRELLRPASPRSAAEAEALLERLASQAEAVARYITGWRLVVEARLPYAALFARRDEFTPDERARLVQNDPDEAYRTWLRPARTLEDVVAGDSIPRLRELRRFLRNLDKAYPAPQLAGEPPVEPAGMMPGEFPLPPSIAATRDRRDAEEIIGSVRRDDRIEFVFTAVVLSLAFILTQYTGKNFGSWEQYLTVFLAGAAGTTAINWALLPWYRSYRAGARKAIVP